MSSLAKVCNKISTGRNRMYFSELAKITPHGVSHQNEKNHKNNNHISLLRERDQQGKEGIQC